MSTRYYALMCALAGEDSNEFFFLGDNDLEREASNCDTVNEDNNGYQNKDRSTSE